MTAAATTPRTRLTPLLLVLFAGSGAAALVYEVVWFQLLRVAVGSSSISLAFLLGSFMGGMCLGSWLVPRGLSRRWHPLRAYALLELGIGAFGVAMPLLLPALGRLYTERLGAGGHGLLWRGAVCAIGLLPPTMLMGATLPAIARWLEATADGLSRLGRFYGANIAGAVAGTLAAGFWLLPVHDAQVATWVAVATNGAIALASLLLSPFAMAPATANAGTADAVAIADAIAVDDELGDNPRAARNAVHVAIALSGATALGAEVIWTRLLSMLMGATVYTFSLILAVYLVGLGIGSALGAGVARRCRRPRTLFGLCQLALPLTLVWAAFATGHLLPWTEPTWIFQEHVYLNPAVHAVWDSLRLLPVLLPATLLWGASFPLAVATVGQGHPDPGRLVGGLYAANTIGAILGALTTALWAIAAYGTHRSQQVLALLAGLAALLLLGQGQRTTARRALAASALALLVTLIAQLLPRAPDGLIAFGRHVADWDANVDYLCVAEGTSASVAVSQAGGYRSFHVSGKVVASTQGIDMRLQRMLGHLPCLAHGEPRSVLIVGCGAGVTAGCFVDYPSIERIVVCEIEPKVVAAARQWLDDVNHGVLDDPRTEIVFDDARHYLATTPQHFDIVTSDPIHPWVRGAASLYSSEYYDLVRAHLNPGGIVTQWVPLYECDAAAVKSQMATFLRAFPGGTAWTSDLSGQGYDLVMLGGERPLRIDLDAAQNLFDEDFEVRQSLDEVGIGTVIKVFATYAGDAASMRDFLQDAQLNVDQSLRLQYLAGRSLDIYRDHEIYQQIRAGFQPPTELFVGSDSALLELQEALAR